MNIINSIFNFQFVHHFYMQLNAINQNKKYNRFLMEQIIYKIICSYFYIVIDTHVITQKVSVVRLEFFRQL